MLKSLFVWLDLHPHSYWILAAGPTLLLLGRIGGLAWRDARHPEPAALSSAWADAAVILLFLFAWRWPFLFAAYEFNPDESQLIAGAITLTHDPVFWRSVDGTTSGPLNFYALLPLHWLGLPLDYFSARLTGLLLVGSALFLCQRTLARLFHRSTAWLGLLPILVFFATVTNTDLIHYSSEHVALLLVAGAVALLAGRKPEDMKRLAVACFLAGCLPLAKLQTVPLSLVLIGWGVWQSRTSAGVWLRRIAVAGVSALLPLGLILLLLVSTGETETALRRYFLNNLFYVESAPTLIESLRLLHRAALGEPLLDRLSWIVPVMVLVSAVVCVRQRLRPPALLAAAAWLTVAAILAILTPRRGFLHYLLLLPVPWTLLLGAAIGGWWPHLRPGIARRWLAVLLLTIGGGLPLAWHSLRPVPGMFWDFAYQWKKPYSSAAMVVRALTRPGDTLAVWGWANRLYVETGLPQATRDTHSTWSIFPGAQRDYHRAAYLADLRRQQPSVFVDAVGPEAFTFTDRATQAHETFPELAGYIRQQYTLVQDLGELRIFARKDLAILSTLTPEKIDAWIGQGRLKNHGDLLIPPALGPLDNYPHKVVGQENVLMLLPPARLEWQLPADVRAITLGYGLDPVAALQGLTDGADFSVELVQGEHTRPLFHRHLDPVREVHDRGTHGTEILLPPFTAGTRLVLRTDPGPAGNTAWDWTYLARLQFHRSPGYLPKQFPGFNRVPDTALAEGSSYAQYGAGSQLFLHAPASLTFTLKGQERRLQFTYGFLPGAYSAGGRTDGAVYRVTLGSAGQPDRVIFERHLQPVTQPGDQGGQFATIDLPAVRAGDRLLIVIDPGPAGNGAWDWTYLHRLTLE